MSHVFAPADEAPARPAAAANAPHFDRIDPDTVAGARTRPVLLCIEGPGGVGKSTLCKALLARCRSLGIPSTRIREFSDTALGRELAVRLAYGSEDGDRLSAWDVLRLCLKDKSRLLHAQSEASDARVVIIDRGYLSQRVLALPFIHDERELTLANRKLARLEARLAEEFDVHTFVLYLPPDMHRGRVETRIQRPMDAGELASMHEERALYAAHAPQDRVLDARASAETLAWWVTSLAGLEAA